MGAKQGGNEERDAELNQGRLGKTSGERGQAELRQKDQKNHQSQKGGCARWNVVHLEKAKDNGTPPYSHKWLQHLEQRELL